MCYENNCCEVYSDVDSLKQHHQQKHARSDGGLHRYFVLKTAKHRASIPDEQLESRYIVENRNKAEVPRMAVDKKSLRYRQHAGDAADWHASRPVTANVKAGPKVRIVPENARVVRHKSKPKDGTVSESNVMTVAGDDVSQGSCTAGDKLYGDTSPWQQPGPTRPIELQYESYNCQYCSEACSNLRDLLQHQAGDRCQQQQLQQLSTLSKRQL